MGKANISDSVSIVPKRGIRSAGRRTRPTGKWCHRSLSSASAHTKVVKIASYYPSVNKNAGGMLMSLKDPRWRFVLHMNWKAQTVPFLLGRIPSKSKVVDIDVSPWDKLDQPPSERVAAISPYAQILRGNYRTPTYLIHGTADDLIPLEQSQRCHEALVSQGVSAGLYVLEGAEHLFDTFSPMGWEAIQAGYDFLFRHVEIAG